MTDEDAFVAEAVRAEREACAKRLKEMADRCEQRKTSGSTNGRRQNQWAMAIDAARAMLAHVPELADIADQRRGR